MSSPAAAGNRKKRGRENHAEEGADVDVSELRNYIQKEETTLRSSAHEVLNKELIERIEVTKALVEKTCAQPNFAAALDTGVVSEVRRELTACFRIGVKLESWLNTYQPPLSAGGNAGVSAEVQEGIFSNVHTMTVGSGDALHRMLAFEKEHALMRTKCSDETVWLRYKAVLEDNQMHDLCKAVLQMHSELMLIGNSLLSNLQHLRVEQESRVASMY